MQEVAQTILASAIVPEEEVKQAVDTHIQEDDNAQSVPINSIASEPLPIEVEK